MVWTRISVVNFDRDNVTVGRPIKSKNALDEHFNTRPQGSANRHLYIVELQQNFADGTVPSENRVDTDLNDLISVFSQNLQVPELFFEDHLDDGLRFGYTSDVRDPVLPSSLNPRKQFHLEYPEPRTLDPREVAFLRDDEAFVATCSLTGRDILCHEWKKGEVLLTTSRKCSFWSKLSDDSVRIGWDAVILCDPSAVLGYVKGQAWTLKPNKSFPFPEGFNVATSRRTSRTRPGQPRPGHASIFDDLSFYYKYHSDKLGDVSDPMAASLFAKRIVTSHYAHILGFVTHQTSSMRARGWSLKRMNHQEVDESREVEKEWSQYRGGEFMESLATNLDQLGIPLLHSSGDTGVVTNYGDWTSIESDLQYLYMTFDMRRRDYDRITTSIAAFVGMKEAERSLNVAKLTTYFALVLTPLAWMASFFSMSPRYLPDGDLKWVYWLVSFATIAMSLVLYRLGNIIRLKDKRLDNLIKDPKNSGSRRSSAASRDTLPWSTNDVP